MGSADRPTWMRNGARLQLMLGGKMVVAIDRTKDGRGDGWTAQAHNAWWGANGFGNAPVPCADEQEAIAIARDWGDDGGHEVPALDDGARATLTR